MDDEQKLNEGADEESPEQDLGGTSTDAGDSAADADDSDEDESDEAE